MCKGDDFNVKPHGMICSLPAFLSKTAHIMCQLQRHLQCSQTQGYDFADNVSLSKVVERKQQGCDLKKKKSLR